MNIIAWIFGVFIGSLILILILGCVINFIYYIATLTPCYWKSRIKQQMNWIIGLTGESIKNIMKIYNLLKNPGDLPSIAEGELNLHHYSNDVNLIYRNLLQNGDGSWEIVLGYGRGFYVHDENLWYGYYDDHKARISNLFSETAGHKIMSRDELIEEGCPKELVDQLTPVPEVWAYQDWDEGLVFVTELVGWYELPTYQEFISEG